MDNDNKMTRRSALKRLGVAVMGAAVASTGMLSMVSCNAENKKRIILYFTGTGNCLYVARQLADEHTELLSIPQLIKHQKYEIECVSVCPRGNYSMTTQGVETKGNCEFCFACIQNCPQKAIQFAKNENDMFVRHGEKTPNARYRNDHVSLMDIKQANNQY